MLEETEFLRETLKERPGSTAKLGQRREKVIKGVRRMPWLSEAKKDVISCDKLWVGANNR